MQLKHSLLNVLVLVFLLSGCGATEEEKAKLEDAQVDLEQLADQIIITFPANNSVIKDPVTTVRADIPVAAEAQEVRLYVDGIEVAKDTDGAPWEISWPAYYWADGNAHTLLLKTITEAGNEVRNNQQYQVIVEGEANSALKFKQGVDGSVLKDSNSIQVNYQPFEDGTHYEVSYSANGFTKTISSQEQTVELTDLGVGEYQVRYRAAKEFSSLTKVIGPWSDPVTVEVLAPDLPSLNSPVVTNSEGINNVFLSWEGQGEGNTYSVELIDGEKVTKYEDITQNQLLIEDIEIGTYQWRLRRTNSMGQHSNYSDSKMVEVGVFTKRFGGSKDDRAKQIINTKDGGYLILAETKSYEVSELVDNFGDDWFIKLDSQGNLDWQYISNSSGRARFNDLIELSDGCIVAVGNDWASDKAVALKLDSSGSRVWETYSRPLNVPERYDFVNITEFENKLIVSSVEWISCGGNCLKRESYYLNELSTETGSISYSTEIPKINGLDISSTSFLGSTNSGDLIIGGYSYPEGSDGTYDYSGGAFVQVLDSQFVQKSSWNNTGKLMHGNLGYILELSSGNYAVIGQGIDGGQPAVSVVSSDGVELKRFVGDFSKDYYLGENIVEGDNGTIFVLFQDQGVHSYPYPLKLMKLNSNLILESEEYVLGFQDYVSSAGLTLNKDGTFTLLFNEGKNNSDSDFDIVVNKQKFDFK